MMGAINLEGGIGTTRGLRGLAPPPPLPLREEGEEDESLPPLSMVGESLRAASRTRFACTGSARPRSWAPVIGIVSESVSQALTASNPPFSPTTFKA